jgi:flagellin
MDIRGFGDVISLAQGRTETALKADVQRLSSGLRINTSADDPSGLAIAEKLQTRVNGLDAGTQSVQDANNALNVADGALQAISDILLRIRTLVVEGTSDLKTADDKADLQAEVDQLTGEINKIAQSTTFNGKILLDGSLSSQTPKNAQLLVPVNDTLSAGGNVLDSTVDPTQPATPQGGSPQFGQQLTVTSYDPVANLLTVTAVISGDPNTFGPLQTATFQVVPGTNTQQFDFPPSPGNPEFTQSSLGGLVGQPVLSFNIGTLSVADVGKTSIVISIDPQTKAAGQALEVNSGDAEGTTVQIDIPAVNTINLGVNDINISDTFDNTIAEYRVDYGINQLANIRAQIGAETVSLQETATDASLAAVNYQAAESAIRDTDVAQTMTDFTRQQILTSLQTSLLSRLFGQAPQIIALVQGSH